MVFLKKLVLFVLAVALFISTAVAIVSNTALKSILDPGFYLQMARQGRVYELIKSAIVESFRTQISDIDDPALRTKLLEAVSGALREDWMDRELEKLLKQTREYLETGKSARFTVSLQDFKAALHDELEKKLPDLVPYLNLSDIPSSLDITRYLTGSEGVLTHLTEPYRMLQHLPGYSLVAALSLCLLMLLICLFHPDGFRWVSMPLILSTILVLLGALPMAFGTGFARPVLVNLLSGQFVDETQLVQIVLEAISALGRRMTVCSGVLLVAAIIVWVVAGISSKTRHAASN